MIIGFYILQILQEGGYVGGLLVTSDKGIPLEFKYTDVLEPTQIQETLYGKSLKKYLSVDLFGKELYANLDNKLDVIFVSQNECLELSLELKIPVFCLEEIESYSIDSEGLFYLENEIGFVKVTCHSEFELSKKVKWELNVKDLHLNFDLMEVFDRVEKAIMFL